VLFVAVSGLEPCEGSVDAEPEVKGQAPSVIPRDLTSFNFDSDEDIQSAMLTKADIATVISSYEKTIGLFAAFLLLIALTLRTFVHNKYVLLFIKFIV